MSEGKDDTADDERAAAALAGLTVLNGSYGTADPSAAYIVKRSHGVKTAVIAAPQSRDAESYFRTVYRKVRAGSDVLVLLDGSGLVTDSWLRDNGGGLGSPDIVIGGGEGAGVDTDRIIGRTHIVPSALLTSYVGVVDVKYSRSHPAQITCRRIDLDQSVQGKPYYDPDDCKGCHRPQFDEWRKTKHAQALKALRETQDPGPVTHPCCRTVRGIGVHISGRRLSRGCVCRVIRRSGAPVTTIAFTSRR